MKINATPLSGVRHIQPTLYHDTRGFFLERYNAMQLAADGIALNISQMNHSHSKAGVLRGLHYQYDPAQAKLVSVLTGRIWDVVVDIRPWSTTFGEYHAMELSAKEGDALYVPAGFAHGFCVLGDEPSDVMYLTDGLYNPKTEGGIRYDDYQLAIKWPIKDPILSERDLSLSNWKQYCDNPPAWDTD